MAQSQPSSSVLSLWALTRFPNYPGEVHVVNTKELFVRVNNQLVAFQPKNVADFKENEPYVCKTSINSLDGNSHPYSVQIGKLSESKSELDAICLNLKEKTSAESNRFRWKNIKNFPVDPESSGAEDQAGMEVLSSTAAEKKLNQRKRRHNENEELQKFILTSKVVAANQSSSSLEASKVVAANQSSSSLEEEYRKTLEKLEQELKEKEKLAREKEELARKSEMLAREKADLARQLKERSTNISPSVQELVKGMQHELKEVLSKQQEQNLRLFEEYKNKLSQEIAEEMKRYREELGQSRGSPSSQTSSAKEGYEEIYRGFSIKRGFRPRLESAETQADFEDLLLRACYDHDEVVAARGPQKKSADFEAGAEAFLEEWAVSRGLSRQDAKQRAKGLLARLAKKQRNQEPRGINRVLSEARRKGQDVEEAKRLYRAATVERRKAGGRPASRRSLDMGSSGRSSMSDSTGADPFNGANVGTPFAAGTDNSAAAAGNSAAAGSAAAGNSSTGGRTWSSAAVPGSAARPSAAAAGNSSASGSSWSSVAVPGPSSSHSPSPGCSSWLSNVMADSYPGPDGPTAYHVTD